MFLVGDFFVFVVGCGCWCGIGIYFGVGNVCYF